MDKSFHPPVYNGCNYLSMLWFKLNHVSERAPGLCMDEGWISSNPLTRMHSLINRYKTVQCNTTSQPQENYKRRLWVRIPKRRPIVRQLLFYSISMQQQVPCRPDFSLKFGGLWTRFSLVTSQKNHIMFEDCARMQTQAKGKVALTHNSATQGKKHKKW